MEASGRAAFVITFRQTKDDDYYSAEFYNDGRYLVMLKYKGNYTPIQYWRSSDAIKLEQYAINSFAVLVRDSNFTIYANGQELTTVKDTTLSEKGGIGLGIFLPDANQTVTVSLDDLIIKK